MSILYKSKRVSIIVILIIFLPLQAVILFQGCSSSRYIRKVRELDRFYEALLAGEEPPAGSVRLFRSLSEEELQEYEKNWSPYRREAVSFLLKWNGFDTSSNNDSRNENQTQLSQRTDPSEDADQAVLEGRYSDAEELYRAIWIGLREEGFGGQFYSYNLRKAVARTHKAAEWIVLLESVIGSGTSRPGEAFFMAWCLEQEKRYTEALKWYESAGQMASSGDVRRRYLWYSLRLILREFPSQLIPRLEEAGKPGNGDGYFDDIFDDYFSILVSRRRWAEMAALIPVLQNAGLEGPATQGLFLLMRVSEEKYTAGEELLRCFEDFSPDPRTYFALRSYPSLWPFMQNIDTAHEDRISNVKAAADENIHGENSHGSDEFYAILMDAGYKVGAFALWEERREDLSMSMIEEFCLWLEQEDRLYDLIGFAGYWYYHYSPDTALRLMSRVFPGVSRYELPEADLPEELVLGVIRRESAFNASISSYAGAVGLMQLMPSTAEDVARRHRIADWDLQDPEDNILLGSLYLEWLKDRPWSASFIDVLAAYNGGGGNLRYWKRSLPGEDPELFIQSIPYRETRDYIRKVIVAAASYRYLETGRPPGEWLDQFYHPF